jgi:acetyl-CoA C-acetyltransferase
MERIYIVDGLRTPIGAFMGSLKNLSAPKLGAAVVKALLEKSKVSEVDAVIVGNVLAAGTGMGPGRQVSIGAGLSEDVPAYSLNMLCCSGMKAIMNGMAEIRAGNAELIIAGGIESMSNAPYIMSAKARTGIKMGDIVLQDTITSDGLTDVFNNYHMGITAENIAEMLKITREAQDEFALNSQQKAIKAVDGGEFKDEIVPIEVVDGKNVFTFDTDEYPNRATNAEKLAKLRPAFKPDGTISAGNSAGINDGAALVIIASEAALKKFNLNPKAEIIATAQAGIDPKIMGLGPVLAVGRALEKAGLKLGDMEYIELNEAFAAQTLGVIRQISGNHGESEEAIIGRCNVNGGGIALGHPLGCTGARITLTLLNILKKRGAKYGIASLCAGGGMGTALILKNI